MNQRDRFKHYSNSATLGADDDLRWLREQIIRADERHQRLERRGNVDLANAIVARRERLQRILNRLLIAELT